jgi:DNA-binding Lrp family transcriptional regulator
MDGLERRLLNEFQRDFPLVERPFVALADRLDTTEQWVLATLARRLEDGGVSRVGAIFRPGAIGVSTLAAMAVPEARLPTVAKLVSAHPEVNHNYEREHALNLWFVAAAEDADRLRRVLAAIQNETGIRVVSLPLLADYYVDLGFDLEGAAKPVPMKTASSIASTIMNNRDRALVAALQDGLSLTTRPFATLALQAGWLGASGGRQAIERVGQWIDAGIIKRFGVIVRHRALGFRANAMCVWDVPAHDVDRLGEALASEPGVTLCYRRRRAESGWPYNLFCMVHGRNRIDVEARLAVLTARHGLATYPHAVLFSRRAFKQCGARYVEPARVAHG